MIAPGVRRVGVATRRSALRCLLKEACAGSAFAVELEEMAPDPVTTTDPRFTRVAAAVVDLGHDPERTLRFCDALRSVRPALPIAAVLCCRHGSTALHLQRLFQVTGPCPVIDAEATVGEVRRSIEALLRGQAPVRPLLTRDGGATTDAAASGAAIPRLSSAIAARCGRHVELISLVALGLSDREIGHRLHLSRHTVHHHIERLRDDLDLRNRIEMAAWAGKHGLYSPAGEEQEPSCPVALAAGSTAGDRSSVPAYRELGLEAGERAS